MKVLQVTPGAMALVPDQLIVSADDYQAWLDVSDCLDVARKQAAEMARAGEAAYEEQKKRGYQDGLAEAKAEAASEALELALRRASYIASVENDLVDVIASACAAIIGKLDNKTIIVGAVRQALGQLKRDTAVTIRVDKSNAKLLRQQLQSLEADFPGLDAIELRADAALRNDQCLLETDLGTIDASIDGQLEVLRQTLARVFGDQPVRSHAVTV